MSDNNPQQASHADLPVVDLAALERSITTPEKKKRKRRRKRVKAPTKTTKPRARKKKRGPGRFAAFKARPERMVISFALIAVLACGVFGINLAMSIPTEAPASVATVIEDPAIIPTLVKTDSYPRPNTINEAFEVLNPPPPPVAEPTQKGKQKNQKRSSADGSYQLASVAPIHHEAPRDDAARPGIEDAAIDLQEPPGSPDAQDDPLKAYASARAYVAETATPGGTMSRQGREKAVECLHPDFVLRLASTIKEARDRGYSNAGVYSACRPPAFGVGGFRDKFNSLHAYGLAVDVHGIGRPGSQQTKRFHEIARRHGVVCPYGPNNRAEFNHCQPTTLKMVQRNNPLRNTITKNGPIDLERMWAVAKSLIVKVAGG